MLDILSQALDAHPEAKGVIFDGFPRTIPQAEELTKLLEKRGTKVDAVVGLEVPEEELTERMINRGKASGRADDNAATIAKRLEVYHRQTQPLKEYYNRRLAYYPINGSGDIEQIFNAITDVIDPIHNAEKEG